MVCNFSSVCSKIPQAFSPWKLTSECKHLYDGTKHTQEPKKSGDRRSRRTSTCDLLIERSCCPVSAHGHVHKWGRTASPEINIYIYSHLFLEKVPKIIAGGKESLLTRWCWDNWIPYANLRTVPCPTHEIHSRQRLQGGV